jgi:SAM-dependent methyltransferase
LALAFETVTATDISEQQLSQAPKLPNVNYLVSAAEETPFPDRSFDLITVGQALHWFKTDSFFGEVKRLLRPGGVFAAWGYTHLQITAEIDAIIFDYYNNIVGPYWDPARRLVEDRYSSIQFPFSLIEAPAFSIRKDWTLGHLIGYLESWSATQSYIKDCKTNPIAQLSERLIRWWPREKTFTVTFPVFLKIGVP